MADTMTWLLNKFPDLRCVNFESRCVLICGKPQSGKSEFSFAMALYHIINGRKVIMVLRNSTKDAVQIYRKALRFAATYKLFCNESFNVELMSSNCSSISNNLLIVINNGHQLKRVNDMVNQWPDSVLLADEADIVGYTPIKSPEHPEYHAALEYSILRKKVRYIYEVSATVFDILVGNQDLLNKDVVVIRPPATYKGLRDGVQFIELPHKVQKWSKGLDAHSDVNIVPIYDQMMSTPVFSAERYNSPCDHPVIVLHRTLTWHEHHDVFLETFINDSEYKDVWTVIVEDSRGMKLYSSQLIDDFIVIGKDSSTFSGKVHVFRSDKVDIQDLLQYLLDNGGAKKFPKIVIKAGSIAGRSRSYVSTDGSWHLTHMYYVPSANETVPNMIQACRLNHNRPDSIPLTMYAPKKTIENLRKGDIMQDEQLERIRYDNETKNTREFVLDGIWSRKKVPKARVCHGGVNKGFKPQKTSGNDGGWEDSHYDIRSDKLSEIMGVSSNRIGKYTVIDLERFDKTSKIYKMIENVQALIIENSMTGKDVEVNWITNKLRETKYIDMTNNQIHGALWTTIRKSRALYNTDYPVEGFIYWKDTTLKMRYS